MLKKKYRLPIQSVLNKSGRTFRSRSFLIKAFSNQSHSAGSGQAHSAGSFDKAQDKSGQAGFNRFGVVISKKVSKLAVKRNWIKRIVLDTTKKFVVAENKNKFDVLIIISPIMIKMEKADIIKELGEALKKII